MNENDDTSPTYSLIDIWQVVMNRSLLEFLGQNRN